MWTWFQVTFLFDGENVIPTHFEWSILGHLEAGIQQTIWIIYTTGWGKFNQSTTWMNIIQGRYNTPLEHTPGNAP